MHLFSPCQSSCKHGFGHLAYRKGSLLAPVCVRLLPTVLAGSPEGCNTSAYWGFLALTCLCSSENPLIGYGIFRLWEYPYLRQHQPRRILPCRVIDGRKDGEVEGWIASVQDGWCAGLPAVSHTCRPLYQPSVTQFCPVLSVSFLCHSVRL